MLEPSSISQNAAGNRYAVWGSVVITAILYYLRFGYDVGFSDQDEFLPLVLQWLDPSLLQQDWFVQMQASTFTIRSGFAGVVLIISKLTSLQAAVLSIHLLTGALLALVLVRLANRLYHNNIASLLFVVIVLVLTPRWNPGGNDIFHSMLVPSSVSWTLSLWSFDFLTRDRLKKAGWLSALSMAIHPLVGLQLGSIFGASLLLSGQKRPQRFLLPFLLVALPSIYFFAEPFSPPAPLSFDAFSTDPAFASSTSILASIRAPHHYLAHTFPILSWFKWLSILGVGGIVIWRDKIFYSSGMMRDAVVKIAAICLGVIGIGGVFTTIIH